MAQDERIAVVGPGRVGSTLGRRWAAIGYDIAYGVRDANDPKHRELRDHAAVSSIADAVSDAGAVLLAVPWTAVEQALSAMGSLDDRVLIDATNPLATDLRTHERQALSGAEQVAAWAEGGRVVKAFNTTGSGNMADPHYRQATPMMPIAGDDAAAKQMVAELAAAAGFEGLDCGPLAASHDLEHLAVLWIRLAYQLGHGPEIAFALLRR